jgi:flagellar hook protein FlgE
MVALVVTQQSYTANLKVLQAQDEIQGRLMDLLA